MKLHFPNTLCRTFDKKLQNILRGKKISLKAQRKHQNYIHMVSKLELTDWNLKQL